MLAVTTKSRDNPGDEKMTDSLVFKPIKDGKSRVRFLAVPRKNATGPMGVPHQRGDLVFERPSVVPQFESFFEAIDSKSLD